uniref:Uncharacterized protein n=1 Tax=Noccaea caerulescens TaxID=107243 RepID=A0A1J3JG66_NOCCA
MGLKKQVATIHYVRVLQVSRKFALGALAKPVSTYDGQQYHLEVSLSQLHSTIFLKLSHIQRLRSYVIIMYSVKKIFRR